MAAGWFDHRSGAHLLGVVAIFAGFATMVFSSSRLIGLFGGAAVFGGLGSTAWATRGMSLLKKFVGVLLITALIGGVLVLVKLMSGR
jgi:hypothetical protein